MSENTVLQSILTTLQSLCNRFDALDQRLCNIDTRFTLQDQRFTNFEASMRGEIIGIKHRLTHIEDIINNQDETE